MKNLIYVITILTSFLVGGCDDFNSETIAPKPVLEAYLFANMPVTEVKVSEMQLFSSEESEEVAVVDAQVKLTNGEESYLLTPDPDKAGYYCYPENDLHVQEGDVWNIQMEHNGYVVEGETKVPNSPMNASLSTNRLEIAPINNPQGLEQLKNIKVNLTWDNANNDYYFITIRNTTENPENIIQLGQTINIGISITTRPENGDSHLFSVADINQYGTYEVRLHKVNKEYVDLYDTLKQDSRNLNEPATNLINGYGLFTAFNYVDLELKIVKP
ncbi:DUF4249 family protein [Prolixibacteraceae bacterium JC049]|nr:DUF4249 family protein [Prolixibacteraceae bacterium JC049]